MDAPEAIAITKSALSISLISTDNNGAVNPAAVIIATVAEPCKTRTNTAAKKANSRRAKCSNQKLIKLPRNF